MAWCRQATSHYLGQCCPRPVSPYGVTQHNELKTLRPGQNGNSFADDIFKWICLNGNYCILIEITQKNVCSVKLKISQRAIASGNGLVPSLRQHAYKPLPEPDHMASFGHTQRKCDVTITSVLRRNDAATSFWCDDVISTSYVCWAISQPFTYWIVLRNRKQFCVDSTLGLCKSLLNEEDRNRPTNFIWLTP